MYKVFTSASGSHFIYETTTNGIFRASEQELALLPSSEGSTDVLRILGEEQYEEEFGGATSNLYTFAECCGEAAIEPELLVLEMTQECNYRCGYCIYSGIYPYERTHSHIALSFDDIDEIVEDHFRKTKPPRYVSFYGGEPLLRFDRIRRLCEKVESLGCHPKYSITTNGSLLRDPNIADYLVKHDFAVNVSFDGLNHDLYRRPVDGTISSEIVLEALAWFGETYPIFLESNVMLSATLAPPFRMMENARYFATHPLLSKLRVSVSLVKIDDCSLFQGEDFELECDKLNREIDLLADEYIQCEGTVPSFLKSLFGEGADRIDRREMVSQSKGFPPGQCEVGSHRLFVTADGDEYMCERVGSYGILGNALNGGVDSNLRQKVVSEISAYFEKTCTQCWLVRVCDMCASSMRSGRVLKNTSQATLECGERKKWYELLFYVYLSRKELGKGMFC